MENGESTRAAAQRETIEEAGANVELKDLFVVANLTHANQVYMLYLAELLDDSFHAGHESSDVKLFDITQVPWENIAFYTVKLELENFFSDLQKGQFLLHEIDILNIKKYYFIPAQSKATDSHASPRRSRFKLSLPKRLSM
jgi:8-oxo-dGTP pyrophosphatase MutT (NUDIX family)